MSTRSSLQHRPPDPGRLTKAETGIVTGTVAADGPTKDTAEGKARQKGTEIGGGAEVVQGNGTATSIVENMKSEMVNIAKSQGSPPKKMEICTVRKIPVC